MAKGKSSRERPEKYAGKFWGVNSKALETFRERIPSGKDRAAGFYLLCTLLLESRWNFHDPDGQFYMTQRALCQVTGWHHSSIRKYRALLAEAGILSFEARGRALTYSVLCEALGITPKAKRSKRKAKIAYRDRFAPITRVLVKNIASRLDSREGDGAADRRKGRQTKDRTAAKGLWLLVNMLLCSDWNPARPGHPFRCTTRDLASATGWDLKTVRKYRDKLVEGWFIQVDFPGGLGVPGSYSLDLGLAGIKTGLENPVKKMELPGLSRGKKRS